MGQSVSSAGSSASLSGSFSSSSQLWPEDEREEETEEEIDDSNENSNQEEDDSSHQSSLQNTTSASLKSCKKSIFELDDEELKKLWHHPQPYTVTEIQSVSRSIKKASSSAASTVSSTNSSITNSNHKGFYSSKEVGDDSAEVQLAKRLHGLCKDISTMRYKMVPSKLKEPIFWEVIIQLLQQRLAEQNSIHQVEESEQKIQLENTEEQQNKQNQQKTKQSSKSSIAAEKKKDLQILKLQEEVKELKKEIKKLQQQQKEGDANAKQTQKSHHKGEWVMSPESVEFLNYPTEVKENMRKEKLRRLNQVKKEMNFILDTDDIKDSNGQWDCCKSNEYNSVCNK